MRYYYAKGFIDELANGTASTVVINVPQIPGELILVHRVDYFCDDIVSKSIGCGLSHDLDLAAPTDLLTDFLVKDVWGMAVLNDLTGVHAVHQFTPPYEIAGPQLLVVRNEGGLVADVGAIIRYTREKAPSHQYWVDTARRTSYGSG